MARNNIKNNQKQSTFKFVINCAQPVDDSVIVTTDFSDFLKKRIKVEGKLGNLQDRVAVAQDSHKIVVSASVAFSKRYLKYLTKKYLKKQELRDYLHVVATDKNTYELKYFNVQQDEEEEEA
jgi:large subunit ribosomal protein L22e